jgi:hypothetical protein
MIVPCWPQKNNLEISEPLNLLHSRTLCSSEGFERFQTNRVQGKGGGVSMDQFLGSKRFYKGTKGMEQFL